MNPLFYFLLFLSVVGVAHNAPMKNEECKKFLMKYGYLPNMKPKDVEYKNALKHFQKYYSLPMTGKLDVKTTKLMQKPRCGKSDNLTNIFTKNPWGKSKLTYKFRSYPINGLERSVAIKEISRAFNLWAKHIPVNFELKPEGPVDIDIYFMPANKGDGPGNTLAYAYYPKNGDIYFDSEPWTAFSYSGTNLFNTAAHEIGHSLGLQHSQNAKALMNPYVFPYDPNLGLFQDDINRIQSLYGRKTLSQNTNICKTNKINAAFYSSYEQAIYLIKDTYTWKLKNGNIQAGYPKLITDEWRGIPESIDAAYYYRNNIYFSKDTTIWRYDGQVHDYLTLIKKIDAAETINEKLYLFSGSEVWSFDMTNNKQELEQGFPKLIKDFWKDAPSTVDAVVFDQKKYFYIFKDSTVYQFNIYRNLIRTVPLAKWLSC